MKTNIKINTCLLPLRLKQLREEKGLNLNQLAEIIGVSRATLLNWESDSYIGKIDIIIALADYFHVSLDWLVGRSNFRQIINKSEEKSLKDKHLYVVGKLQPEDFLNISQYLETRFKDQQSRD